MTFQREPFVHYTASVTAEEREAVRSYSFGTTPVHMLINRMLRGQAVPEEMEKLIPQAEKEAIVANLRSLGEKSLLKEEMTVYRGLAGATFRWENPEEGLVHMINTHGVGYHYIEYGFASTSHTASAPYDFVDNTGMVVEVILARALNVIDVDHVLGKVWEEELLVMPGTVFEVVGHQKLKAVSYRAWKQELSLR